MKPIMSSLMWASTQKLSLCVRTAMSLISLGHSKKPTIYSLPNELFCKVLSIWALKGCTLSSWYAPTRIFIICTLITNARHVNYFTKPQNHVNSGNKFSVPLGPAGTTIPRNFLVAPFRKWSIGLHEA